MIQKWLLLVSALMSLAAFAGCSEGANTIDTGSGAPREVAAPSELVAMSRPPVPDLPVPIGFELDQSDSRSFAAAQVRWVAHTYRGHGDQFAVSRFYKRQMQASNRWTLVSDSMVQGVVWLRFAKGSEQCEITIRDPGYFQRTEVHVELYPTGKVETSVDR